MIGTVGSIFWSTMQASSMRKTARHPLRASVLHAGSWKPMSSARLR
jgi:hypothetical protein